MFFLDVSPEEACRRIREARREQEMFEDITELRRVRVKALSLALVGKWTIVDAGKPVEEVEREIQKLVLST
jgi:thymidylate kinase